MVDNDSRFVLVPITLCCHVENAIHILVVHLEDILFAQQFAKLDKVILLQALQDLLMSAWCPNVMRDIFHLLT